jgi:hypothetical protein
MTMPASLEQAVEAADFFRRSASVFKGQAGHKEWLHFAAYAGGVDVLANFSVVDDLRPGARSGDELGRVTCLVRDGEWDGDIDHHSASEVRVKGGHLDVRMGESSAIFREGEFHLSVKLRNRPIEIELTLRPLALPTQANNVSVADCPPIFWLVVPRLSANGTVTIAGRKHEFRDAPAYHDHNWGYFRWGRDFVWEWGYGVPGNSEDLWTMVFVRFMNRGHFCDLMQGVLLWEGPRQARIFRGEELTVRHDGFLAPTKIFKLPRVMGLVSEATATDIPKRLVVTAEARGDHVEFTFTSSSVGQVIIPNDDDLGVTVINEVTGHLELEGCVRGRRFAISEPSIFEFLGD